MTKGFIAFRNEIVKSLNKHGVKYKVFGGAVICLIDDNRETEDLDIFIEQTEANINAFIEAISESGFCAYEVLADFIFGTSGEDYKHYGTFFLKAAKEEWDAFHIDLCFKLGQYNYNALPEEEYDDNGLKIKIVPFRDIATMKANVHINFIYGPPREKDINDIKAIADYLGVDPATGKPKEYKPKSGFMSWIGDAFGRSKQ
jgi:predicted nucleotidyltransferase